MTSPVKPVKSRWRGATVSVRRVYFANFLNRKDEMVAVFDVTLSPSLMPDLLERPNALAQLVETVLQQSGTCTPASVR